MFFPGTGWMSCTGDDHFGHNLVHKQMNIICHSAIYIWASYSFILYTASTIHRITKILNILPTWLLLDMKGCIPQVVSNEVRLQPSPRWLTLHLPFKKCTHYYGLLASILQTLNVIPLNKCHYNFLALFLLSYKWWNATNYVCGRGHTAFKLSNYPLYFKHHWSWITLQQITIVLHTFCVFP